MTENIPVSLCPELYGKKNKISYFNCKKYARTSVSCKVLTKVEHLPV